MKEAFQKDDALLADIAAARDDESHALHTWWLGQSGFLVMCNGRTVLFDPYLSDSLTRKYAETDKPHNRITELVIDPIRLEGIDVITSSHNHTDHLDQETLLALFEANPKTQFIIPEANREFVATRMACDPDWPMGLNDGVSIELEGIAFHGLASAHDELKTNDKGEHHFMGFVIELGPWTIYHSGDTRLYDGLTHRLNRFSIDLAFLPINGYKPERRVAGNLNTEEAAQLASDCNIGTAIPHHYDMFEFNTADPIDFGTACAKQNVNCHILRNGEKATFSKS
ncbi:MAG: MBL fold metallo-hydrolase [Verrucomicrobia bacterium]|nr:MBL fold metallo-hydrolase [Verrucomicrobiota bacterium]MDA1066566.1 MBL fold metallo-hydrolase [Verrucomicrobiota bacterium]